MNEGWRVAPPLSFRKSPANELILRCSRSIIDIENKGGYAIANTTNFSVRMDSEVKKQCEALYNDLGMTLTTAINVFLRQSLRVGGLPFELRQERPNKETIAAMLEVERIAHDPSVKKYDDLDELFAELKS